MLKSLFAFLLIFCFVQNGYGEEAKNYEEALSLSLKTDKQIFLIFSADWCGYCKKMEKVFKDEKVSKRLDDFIFLKLEKEEEKELVKRYGVKSIPDYMILNKYESIIKRHTGYKNEKEFLMWLNSK